MDRREATGQAQVLIQFAAKMEGHKLVGVAHTFGQTAIGNSGKWEAFAETSFDKVLANPVSDILAYYNHNDDMLLGRQSNGSLKVGKAPSGLSFACDLPDTSYARDLEVLVAGGYVNGASFTVMIGKYQMMKGPDGEPMRFHTEVAQLVEISPAGNPIFAGSSVMLASFQSGQMETAKSQAIKIHQAVLRLRS